MHNAKVMGITLAEVNVRELSDEERTSGDVDYLTGFLVMDRDRRVLVVEGEW